MPWYYIYKTATGALTSVSSSLDGTVAANPNLGYSTKPDLVDQAVLMWDTVTRDFIARPPRLDYELSQLEFTRRFTLTEDATLEGMALDPATPISIRAQINTLNKRISRASMIDLRDPDTIAGVDVAMQLLQLAGVLTAEAAVARKAAILMPMPINE